MAVKGLRKHNRQYKVINREEEPMTEAVERGGTGSVGWTSRAVSAEPRRGSQSTGSFMQCTTCRLPPLANCLVLRMLDWGREGGFPGGPCT
jgi:hypothetical protein